MKEKLLKDQLAANRRLLQLLAQKRSALQRRVSLLREMHNPGVGREPFFYSAVDANDEPGILIQQNSDPTALLGTDNRLRFTGMVKLQDDAPFIWTHIGVTLRYLIDTSPASNTLQEQEDADLDSVFKTASEMGAEFNNALQIGFIDSSSGRNLMQPQLETTDAAFAGEEGLFPVTLFNLNNTDAETAPAGGGKVPSHGPTGLYQLPAEVEMPTSGAVEVILKSSRVPGSTTSGLNNPRFRAYVTLGGYKIRA